MVDNFIKGPLTSILGLLMIITAFVGWLIDGQSWSLDDWQAITVGVIGLVFLFVKDRIPDFVTRIFNGLFGRWFPNASKDEQPKQ